MRNYKRIISVILALLMVIGMYPVTAVPAHATLVEGWGMGEQYDLYNPITRHSGTMGPILNLHSINGQVAYCIDPTVAEGSNYTVGSSYWDNIKRNWPNVYQLISRAIYCGYPNAISADSTNIYNNMLGKSYTRDYLRRNGIRYAQAATQIMVHHIVLGYVSFSNGTVVSTGNSPFWGAGSTTLREIYNDILTCMNSIESGIAIPSFANDTPYGGNRITLEMDASGTRYFKVVTDTNGVLSHYNFEQLNGNGLIFSRSGNDLSILATQTAVDNLDLMSGYVTAGVYSDIVGDFNPNALVCWGPSDGDGQSLCYYDNTQGSADPSAAYLALKVNAAPVTVQKVDADTNSSTPQGDASLTGAHVGVYNSSDIELGGGTTDSTGSITFNGIRLDDGCYTQEITPPAGYALNPNEIGFASGATTATIKETVLRGGIYVQKTDAASGSAVPQGDTSFDGIVFDIYNQSANSVLVNNNWYSPGSLVTSITTDVNGYAATANTLLPYGTYLVKERSVPEDSGYYLNDSWSATVYVHPNSYENGTLYSASAPNTPIRGGVKVQKVDTDLQSSTPQGDAKIAGAEISIINMSQNPVIVNGVYAAMGDVVMTITTDENGIATTGNLDLPYGRYQLQETKAPDGYQTSYWTQTIDITENGKIIDLTSEDNRINENVILGGVGVQKYDDATDSTSPQGNASLEGAVIEVSNGSAKAVIVNGDTYQPGDIITTITTDVSGYASTGNFDLPYGTYILREIQPPQGYSSNIRWSASVQVRDAGVVSVADGIVGLKETVLRGGIKIGKVDSDLRAKTAQGDATFYGAEISIINISPNPVVVNNVTYATGETVMVLTTDANGEATTGDADLPIGTYQLTETKAPEGYTISYSSPYADVAEHRTIVDLSGVDKGLVEIPIKGSIAVQKKDADSNSTSPSGGASLEGAMFQIVNKSAKSIVFENHTIEPNEVITTITTDASGIARTASKSLPYGTYEVTEITAPEGYSVNTEWKKTVQIREDGKEYMLDEGDAPANQVWRGDWKFTKINGDASEPLANIPFRVTSVTTGESHIIVTDENGVFDSSANQANRNNGNDAAVSSGTTTEIDETSLNSASGVWFSGSLESNSPKAELGSFPFDTYRVEELPCEANKNLKLITFEVEIHVNGTVVDSGTVENHADSGFNTLMLDNDTQKHVTAPAENAVLIDRVDYMGLAVGERYEVRGKLVDKDSGEDLQVGGIPVTAEKEFTPSEAEGSSSLEYRFNASDLAGKTVVAYVYLLKNGVEVAKEENIFNSEETVHFPAISTSAHGENGESMFKAEDNVKIIDTVTYENLVPGLSYTVTGRLMNKDTGLVLTNGSGDAIETSTSLEPVSTSGTVDIEFTIDASDLAGASLVAFEQVSIDNVIVARHEDINDADQTVTFPEISTILTDSDNQHTSATAAVMTLKDSVSYSGLTAGETYTMRGVLMNRETGMELVDSDGNTITAEKEFTPDSESGTVEMTFTLNSGTLSGIAIVAYETAYIGSEVIAEHKDINDESQTVYISSLRTVATDAEGNKETAAQSSVTIQDEVFYVSLRAGETYTVIGTLMDKATGEPVMDSQGNSITQSKSFTPESSSGSVILTFTFNAENMDGKSIVAFEELYLGSGLIAEHKDLDDEDQTVRFPRIGTKAHTADNELNMELSADSSVTVVDTVTFENLTPEATYILFGTVMDKTTGNPAVDASGNYVTSEVEFTPQTANGTQDVSFTFDGTAMENKTLVVFEELIRNDVIVAEHKDADDSDQMIYIPKIRTSLANETGGKAVLADTEVKLTDTVTYQNLIPGKAYTVTGTLMDKKTGAAARDSNGNTITAQKEFTPDTADGTIEIEFTFNASGLSGTTLVAYERLANEYGVIAKHEDITDTDQTVYIPEISTTLAGNDGQKEFNASGRITVTDAVAFKSLNPGENYTVSGTLVYKDSGDPLLNSRGNVIKETKTFKPDTADGSIELTFKIDASNLEGCSVVAFEELALDGTVIAEHKDLEDQDQTITFPKISTVAHDSDNSHEFVAAESVTITDTVTYENLTVGNEYTIQGTIMDKATGEEVKDRNGNTVFADKVFTAESANGTVDVEFTFDGTGFDGKTLAVFEELYSENALVAEHKDMNDADQTVMFPEIGTKLMSEAGGNMVKAESEIILTDTVTYKNLTPGKSYTLSGTMINKTTVNVMKDADGNDITSEKTFTPETADGTVEVVFTFDGSSLSGVTLVAFEQLSNEFGVVARHEDINDDDQTVYISDLRTTLTGSQGEKELNASGTVRVADTVVYTTLKVGETYIVKGTLMNKATGEALIDTNGNPITASKEFKAMTADGSVELAFTFDASSLSGASVVAFEELSCKGTVIGEHKDLEDKDQTVTFPKISTVAHDSNNSHEFMAADSATIIDTITYENLIAGREYTVKGTLMDKASGHAVKGGDGNTITAEKVFTADAASGTVDIEFVFDGTGFEGKTLVAFEELYAANTLIAEHKDISDAAQTVMFPEIGTYLVSEGGNNMVKAEPETILTDTISYKNLTPGNTYTVSGTLMDKATGNAVKDDKGYAITAESEFVPESADGSVQVVFRFDGSDLEGKIMVAYEKLSNEFGVIAVHEDINDEDQTVFVSALKTTLTGKNGEKELNADGTATLIDAVVYSTLKTGETYSVTGTLMDKATGTALRDASGNPVTATKEFKARTDNGNVELKFVFDASSLAGKTLVAFEELSCKGVVIGEHKDLEDEDQTVTFPMISTVAHNSEGGHEFMAAEAVSVIDTVSYSNLIVGNSYTVKGILINKATGKAVKDGNGDSVTAEKTFTAAEENGSVDLEFAFNGSNLENKTLVAFEELYVNGVIVAEHKDVNDPDQTVLIPQIRTELKSEAGSNMANTEEELKLTDTVTFRNLTPGDTYTVSGTLVNKETGRQVTDSNGNPVISETEFTPDSENGTVEVNFIFDSRDLAGCAIVAYEKLSNEFGVIASHEDINDENQTVYIFVPELKTALTCRQGKKELNAGGNITLIDTVEYQMLKTGETYTVTGTLMDKETGKPILDASGKPVSTSETFTANERDGKVELSFTINTDGLAGKTLVAFEELTRNDEVIAEHKDLNDTEQTVWFPAIATVAHDQNDSHEFLAADEVTVIDTIRYSNLQPGQEYIIKGTLIDKATGVAARDNNGSEITAERCFAPSSPDGTVNVEFTFNGSNLQGKTLVAYEELVRECRTVAEHKDINDVDQTITIPQIRTTLQSENRTHQAKAEGVITLTDTVVYTNLIAGKPYKLTGTLVNRADGQPVMSGNKAVTASTSFTPEAANGSVDITFRFDASDLAGQAAVACEKLSNEFGVIAVHEDRTDDDQTVWFPAIATTAYGRNEDKEIFAGGETTVIDAVSYTSLIPGKTYILTGSLIDKSSWEAAEDANGNAISSIQSFVPNSKDGSVNMTFTADMTNLAGKNLVVFETLKCDDGIVAEHKDINDEGQTVRLPRIRTIAHDINGGKEFLADGIIKVIDTVEYENLTPGREYKLVGTLMDKSTGKVMHDKKNALTATAVFTAEAANGTIDVEFTFDASNMKNVTLVAFEQLSNSVQLISAHEDLEDEAQTIRLPEIRTTLLTKNETHVVPTQEEISLIDTVLYSNLIAGNTYKVSGVLMDKSTGYEVLDAQGNRITAESEFTAEAPNGSADVKFSFNSHDLLGIAVVAYEELSNSFGVIATHKDLMDEGQTAYIPEIKTVLAGKEGEKIFNAVGEVTLTDTVEYTMLQPDQNYTMKAALMNKATNEPLCDASGKPITAETSFKAKETEGIVNVSIKLDASKLEGVTLVAFEDLYINDELITSHSDINDEDQSVCFPKLRTMAGDRYGAHVSAVGEETKIIDTVNYFNLIPGELYTMTGTLKCKSTGKDVKDSNYDVVHVSKDFVPNEPDGSVDIIFTTDTTSLVNDSVVVFERLYHEDRLIGEHADLNDEDQTIHFPSISTSAKDADGSTIIAIDSSTTKVTIIDTVSYQNLVPGEIYKLSGTLMSKPDGSPIRNAEGEVIIAEKIFTPEKPNGSVDVEFTVPKDSVSGRTVVVFEGLMLGEGTVAVHRDLNDEAQTVKVTYLQRGFKFDATTHTGLEGAEFRVTDKGLSDSAEPVELLETQTVVSNSEGYFYYAVLPGHQYSILETIPPEGYLVDKAESIVDIADNGVATGDIEIPNVRGGTVVISKTDAITGQPLSGCEVTIYKDVIDEEATARAAAAANKEVSEITPVMKSVTVFTQKTDSKGRIYFYTDDFGKFYYRETATRSGYYLNDEEYTFTINQDLTITGETRFSNVPYGTAVIKKTDASGKPLSGAQIQFYDANDKYLGQGVSDSKGRIYFVSPGPGSYYFKEVKAPNGYSVISNMYHFTIAQDFSITGTLTIVNRRATTVTVTRNGFINTGDTQNIGLWIALTVISLSSLAGAGYVLARKTKRGKKNIGNR